SNYRFIAAKSMSFEELEKLSTTELTFVFILRINFNKIELLTFSQEELALEFYKRIMHNYYDLESETIYRGNGKLSSIYFTYYFDPNDIFHAIELRYDVRTKNWKWLFLMEYSSLSRFAYRAKIDNKSATEYLFKIFFNNEQSKIDYFMNF
ncbi:MAG: hypothetical protein KKB59_19015, partial [Spirochaetes bacterium]|nr:hypothetical protein [Spirochaetota bacterium]